MRRKFWLTIIILAALFYAVYAGFFYLFHGYLTELFLATAPSPEELVTLAPPHPSNAFEMFSTYGAVMGLGFMAFGLVNSFFFWGVIALARAGKNIYARFIMLLLIYGILLGIGLELAFSERPAYELARSISFFMGYPLIVASTVTIAAIIVTGIASLLIRKTDE